MHEIQDFVNSTPVVESFFSDLDRYIGKLEPFWKGIQDDFCIWPAAEKHHHNFTCGLLLHTAEVWKKAKEFEIGSSVAGGELLWGTDELFNAVLLHDAAKVKQYRPIADFCWKWQQMEVQQEVWTLCELAKYGISLTDNELNGLLQAEGAHSRFRTSWRPMSVFVNAADLWSSQINPPVWEPAKANCVSCPLCSTDMVLREGRRGVFYGCGRYPECRGVRQENEVPSSEQAFLQFLKERYG